MKKLILPISILFASTQLVGCLPGLENPFSDFKIIKPQAAEFINASDLVAYEVIVQLPSGTTSAPIYFNGQNVSSCFNFAVNPAVAQLTCMSDYVRQNTNTLTIAPGSLTKSLSRSFIMDTLGPYVNIKNVCYSGGSETQACVLRDTGDVEVSVSYSDPSAVVTATLNGESAVADNGKDKTFFIPVADSYSFVSTDALGYTSTHVYQRDGLRIDELFNVRIDESMLNELRPLINKVSTGVELGKVDSVHDSNSNQPWDHNGDEPILKDIKVDMGISKLGADVYYVEMGKFDMQELSIDNDSNANLHAVLNMDPIGVEGVDWVLADDTVQDVDNVGVEVLMHINDYTDCWDTWLPDWLGGGYTGTCGILGFVRAPEETCIAVGHDSTCNYGKIAMDVRMYIERMRIDGDVAGKDGGEMVTNGKFSLDLINHGSTDVMQMIDVKASMSGEQGSGVSQQGLIDAIIASPAMRDTIKNIVVDVINDNLDEISLGANFKFDTGAEMDVNALIENLATDIGSGGDDIGDLRVAMSGVFETIQSDPSIKPALGSYYVNDQPNLPLPADNGSNLAVTVNTNLINQTLLAMYNTGATHLTLLNGVMHTGFEVTDTLGANGDLRIELNPSSPGEFILQGTTINQAFIVFRGAEAIVGIKKDGQWVDSAMVNIDIKAGVKMQVLGEYFTMTIASTPEYTINSMTDFVYQNGFLQVKIPRITIEALLKVAVEWGIPFVADSLLTLDVSKFGISENLYTESIDTSTGHLIFQTSVKEPAP